uniref:Photosystem I reaction center subunit VIII n=4 Tax=Pinus subgen. Strobus TaxID=139272 RepID=A0A8K1UB85_PINAR|nr:PSI I protein [Pinus squamata]AET44532.1 photosystem I subunit VIII [Pinus chiapensis]AET46249.1 photosystem I subunit VIII [Pinus pumila]UDN39248.1 PSI I protein [Pinus armandii]WJG29425.1 photosystem I subunit I [Pinus bhutanica]AXR86172.1 PSI I protein [Pinus squamata]
MIIPNLPFNLPFNLPSILPSILVPLVGLLLPAITMVLSHLYIQNDEIL